MPTLGGRCLARAAPGSRATQAHAAPRLARLRIPLATSTGLAGERRRPARGKLSTPARQTQHRARCSLGERVNPHPPTGLVTERHNQGSRPISWRNTAARSVVDEDSESPPPSLTEHGAPWWICHFRPDERTRLSVVVGRLATPAGLAALQRFDSCLYTFGGPWNRTAAEVAVRLVCGDRFGSAVGARGHT